MVNFTERFKVGFALTDEEWAERKEIENAKKGYPGVSLSSLEFHPTFIERIRRGIQYVLWPEEMRG